jgi:ATP-dependent Lhr-like helicase
MRAVLLGDDPPVTLTHRATARLATVRQELLATVHPDGTVLIREPGGDVRWWTWAGFRTNATLTATLAGTADPAQRTEEAFIRLREDLLLSTWKAATADASERLCLPEIDDKALHGLKFSAALPERLAIATLATRLADLDGAAAALREPTSFRPT